MFYGRQIVPQLKKWLFKGKIIILYGARQVGKTTLVKALAKEYAPSLYYNCEQLSVKEVMESGSAERMRTFLGDARLVILDEAQKIRNIGPALKILIDTYPEIQIVATGSSSFDLANQITEPLTGRNIKFTLYPLSLLEISQKKQWSTIEESIDLFLRFGMYPDVIVESSQENMRVKLDEIAGDYLYKDVLEFERLKRSDLLIKLLQALALQLGNEVSLHELAVLLKTSPETIERYIHLLEQTFVIFRLPPFSRNLRKELAKKNKIYFYDTGIRNALLQNFTPLRNRTDIGSLWENFCIVERMKRNQAFGKKVNMYFWRTYDQKEIDYIEEADGLLNAFEFKWSITKKTKAPREFLETYKKSSFEIITKENCRSFLTG